MTIVHHTIDAAATLAPHDLAAINRLEARFQREGDASLDFSDLPDITPAQLAAARRRGRPPRTGAGTDIITARLDRDIVQWLKSSGRGYQTRMNAILRAAMSHEPPAAMP